ncbi:MAG: hypothetical protein ACE5KA_00835 [Nitrososphaerales archaeon]
MLALKQGMAFESTSTRTFVIIFGLIAAGAAIFIGVAVFPASNLIREMVTAEGTIASSSDGECVVDTPDRIPKVIKNCDLPSGSEVTVSFQEGMYEASIVSQP